MEDQSTKTPTIGTETNPDLSPKLKKFLNTGTFDNAFTTQQMSTAIDKLVEIGDEARGLFLRTVFIDFDHKAATIRLLRKAVHFKDKELEDMIMNDMAATPAIGGHRTEQLVDAVIGQHNLNNQQKKGFWAGLKDKLAMGDGNGDK